MNMTKMLAAAGAQVVIKNQKGGYPYSIVRRILFFSFGNRDNDTQAGSFFRIGLANLPVILGIDLFSFPAFVLLLVIKVLGQALISGTLFLISFFFSNRNIFLRPFDVCHEKNSRKTISFMGISLAGAFVSNSLQFLLAVLLMFGKSAVYIIPPVFSLGTLTALFLGWFASEFEIQSVWYQRVKAERFDFVPDNSQAVRHYKSENESEKTKSRTLRDRYLRIGSGISLF